MISSNSNPLLVISTGGTIDKVYFDKINQYQVGSPAVKDALPTKNLNWQYEFIEPLKKDSLDMTLQDREQLVELIKQSKHTKVLITHGTDSLQLTAQHLAEHIPSKLIILTGSFLPYKFTESDALLNLGVALGGLSTLSHGTYVAMSGQVYPAHLTIKNYERQQFEYQEQ